MEEENTDRGIKKSFRWYNVQRVKNYRAVLVCVPFVITVPLPPSRLSLYLTMKGISKSLARYV